VFRNSAPRGLGTATSAASPRRVLRRPGPPSPPFSRVSLILRVLPLKSVRSLPSWPAGPPCLRHEVVRGPYEHESQPPTVAEVAADAGSAKAPKIHMPLSVASAIECRFRESKCRTERSPAVLAALRRLSESVFYVPAGGAGLLEAAATRPAYVRGPSWRRRRLCRSVVGCATSASGPGRCGSCGGFCGSSR
jgi:hypothetical protein